MAAQLNPIFAYRDDQVLALFEDNVIASGSDFAKVAETAEEYLDGLRKERKSKEHTASRKTATHIETPNGLKGEILSNVEGVWGREITVRMENGQIRHYATAGGDEDLKYSSIVPEVTSPAEILEERLGADYAHGRDDLIARLNDLSEIHVEAAHFASLGAPLSETQRLHKVAMSAQAEAQEVQEVLAHLEAADTEAMAPPSFSYAAVEQADLGRAKDDSWLDVVAHEMVAESEAQDFDKLMSEGPTLLVGSMDDAQIADTGIVREAAISEVVAKTAGFQGEVVEEYREAFVAAAEQARRREATYRQERAQEKTAAAQESHAQAPDESLFL